MSLTDEELVEAFQAGDTAAFDALVTRWDRKIQGAVYRVLGPGDDVRDVAQETFLKAYRALPGFKKEARFSSWVYQIALNVCRDRLRRRRGRTVVGVEEIDEDAMRTRRIPSALDTVVWNERSRRVAAAVAQLPDAEREVIVLKEYEGLTFTEIAEALQIPTSTVKTRLYRGLGALKQQLVRQGVVAEVTPVRATP